MKIKTLYILLVLFGVQVNAQNYKYGEVSISELLETEDEEFPEAPAKLLIRDIEFEYGKALYVYEKIKIYNSEGIKYSNWEINYDDIVSLKAAIYNFEDGRIVKTKVSKESIFKEKVSENYSVSKIAFPNVKPGSILEIKYKVLDIGLRYLNAQAAIPIGNLNLLIKNSYGLKLNIIENQLSDVELNRIEKSFQILFIGKNIDAVKDEVYVSNIDKYKGRIYIEPVYGRGSDGVRNWGDVSEKFNKVSWFGEESRPRNFYKDELEKLIGTETDQRVIAENIYYFLQDYVTWTDYYGRSCENAKRIFNDKEGSTGEINILLTSMLRKAGLNANPILISSINNGYISYPTLKGFNNTLASVEINKKIFLLDAARKNAGFGELSSYFINGIGLIVYPDDSYKLEPTIPTKMSNNIIIANFSLDIENLSISGSVKSKLDNYYAYRHRNNFEDLEEEDVIIEIEEEIENSTVSNLKSSTLEDSKKPIIFSYDIEVEDLLEDINDKIYIAPLLFYGIEENIFSQEDRRYPIYFKHPFAKNRIINIKIPEGYKVENLPSSKSFLLQNNIGSFEFSSSVNGQTIQNSYTLRINYTIIPIEYYKGLQTMYSEFLKISKSKIVLSKI
ncbi:MAG: DUF3857 domain-containing protein [Flavobacteriaceae bacterium]